MENKKLKTHEGEVVSVSGNKLVSKCDKNHQHHHTLAKDAKVSCEGQACKLEDLKPGTPIRVTTSKDDKNLVTAIECIKPAMTSAH